MPSQLNCQTHQRKYPTCKTEQSCQNSWRTKDQGLSDSNRRRVHIVYTNTGQFAGSMHALASKELPTTPQWLNGAAVTSTTRPMTRCCKCCSRRTTATLSKTAAAHAKTMLSQSSCSVCVAIANNRNACQDTALSELLLGAAASAAAAGQPQCTLRHCFLGSCQ